jgi:hypothetical protein
MEFLLKNGVWDPIAVAVVTAEIENRFQFEEGRIVQKRQSCQAR